MKCILTNELRRSRYDKEYVLGEGGYIPAAIFYRGTTVLTAEDTFSVRVLFRDDQTRSPVNRPSTVQER